MAVKLVEIYYKLIDQVSGAAQKINTSLEKITPTTDRLGGAIEKLTAQKSKDKKITEDLTGSNENSTKITWAQIGAYAALYYSLQRVTNGIIDSAKEYEMQKTALTAMMGSAVLAKKTLDSVAIVSKQTPFERKDLVEYVKQLYSAGVAQQDLIPIMLKLGDVAAAVGTEKLPEIVYVYRQIIAAGRAVGNDFRQLENAAVPIFEYLSKLPAFAGKTNLEIRKLGSEGMISAKDIEAAFQLMTSEGGKFYNMMGTQSKTTVGILSNLKDSLGVLAVELGTPLLWPLKQILNIIIALTNVFSNLNPSVKAAVGTFIVATTAVSGLALGIHALSAAVGGLSVVVGGLSMALRLLGIATGVGLAFGAIAFFTHYTITHLDKVKLAWLNLEIIVLKVLERIADAINKFPILLKDFLTNALQKVVDSVLKIFNIPLKINVSKVVDTITTETTKTKGVDYKAKIESVKKEIEALNKLNEEANKKKQEDEIAAQIKTIKEKEEVAKRGAAAEAERMRLQEEEAKKASEKLRKENEKNANANAEIVQAEIDERTRAFQRKQALADTEYIHDQQTKAIQLEEEIAFNQSLLSIKNISEEQIQQIKNKSYELETARLAAQKEANMQAASLELEDRIAAFAQKQLLDETIYADDVMKKQAQLEAEKSFNLALLEIENLSAQEKYKILERDTQIENEQAVLKKGIKEKYLKIGLDNAQKFAEGELSLQDALKNGILGTVKEEALAYMKLEATKMFQVGSAKLIASMGLDPMGYAYIAGSLALMATGKAAINGIKLAEGGVVMPKPGGVPAIIGEGGRAEAVIPLDDPRAMDVLGRGSGAERVIILTDDGKELAKGIYKKQTELLRTGELSPRL